MKDIKLLSSELKFSYIRSPGPGGQNVNKVATAVQLRFNIVKSESFSEETCQRLLTVLQNKLTTKGEMIIKATRYRTQERNKEDAIERLVTLLKNAAKVPKKRKKTKPSLASKERRIQKKKLHAKTKSLRGRPVHHE